MLKTGFILKNKYLIQAEIVSFEMTNIYKAFNVLNKQHVIVKKVKKELNNVVQDAWRLDKLCQLDHVFLPKFYEVVMFSDNAYIIMDYIDGESTDKVLQRKKSFSEKQVVEFGLNLTDVLTYLHTRGILHSDIKPANIMITYCNSIKLIDFDIALLLNKSCSAKGRSGCYASPEQYMGKELDFRSDIYSLGATLYHYLTGEAPALAYHRIRPLNLYPIKYSAEIMHIIAKAMQLNPNNRYQNIEEMNSELSILANK